MSIRLTGVAEWGREGGVRGVRREVGVQGLVVGTEGRGFRNREGRV
jgi:hypothetical protein